MIVSCDGRTLVTEAWQLNPRKLLRAWDDPLDVIAWMSAALADARSKDSRWVGYFSYDLGRLFEQLPSRAADDLQLPLFVFTLEHPAAERQARPVPAPRRGAGRLRSTFTRPAYLDAVAKAVEYIRAGDIFQVNLSQRFTSECALPPEVIFDHLRRAGGARYGAILRYEQFSLVSHSPELFLRVSRDPATGGRRVVTRPIKGTRPRLPGMEDELRHSVKDQAELNMIIDLERNDLGRVCEIGSVEVTQPRAVEAHPTVYHGVATVEGTLRDDVSFVDLLRATFPGGSVTGAPKIRAMEIIDELEPVRRGPYCGAIGYLAADGSAEFNVAIRTMILKDGLAHVPVGGAVVADSTPAGEFEETLVKARAMFDALGIPLPEP